MSLWQISLTAGILALSAGIRLWAIGDLTPGVWYDEAVNAIDARLIVHDGFPILFVGNNGREPLFVYSLAASFNLFGYNTLALRFVSAAAGLLTVAVSFALVRNIWGARPALIATALLATSVWPLILSRLGMRTALLPLLLSAAVFWLWTGLQKRSAWRTALGGVFFGLAAYSYTAVRVAPVWVLVFCVVWIGIWRGSQGISLRRALALVGAFWIASSITAAPLVAYFSTNPDQLTTRIATESILDAESNQLRALGENAVSTIGMLSVRGDPNGRHNLPGRPVLDPPLTAFGLVGLAVIAARYRRPESVLALLWLATMFLPGILSGESPHQLRTAGIIPIVYVFPAVGLIATADWIMRVIPTRRAAWAYGLMTVLLLWSTGSSTKAFLIDWAEGQETADHFQGAQRIAGSLVENAGQTATSIVATPIYRGFPAGSLLFNKEVDRLQVRLFEGHYCLAIPSEGRLRYVLPRDTRGPWEVARNAIETHETSTVVDKNGDPWVQVYELDANELLLPQPSRPTPAALGDQYLMIGYDLQRSIRAGESSFAHIYLQVDEPLPKPGHYQFFAHLVNIEDRSTPAQFYVDSCVADQYWKSGDHLVISVPLDVGLDVDEGTYQIAFGMFEKFDNQPLQVRDGSGRTIGDALYLGPLRVIGDATAQEQPQHELGFKLGKAIALKGYDQVGFGFEPGGTIRLTLYWEVLSPLEEDYAVFVQLLDADGQVVAQKDNYPQNGTYPTSIWTEQDPIVADEYELELPAEIGRSPHRIIVGMYRLADGSRLSIRDSDGQLVGDHVVLDK